MNVLEYLDKDYKYLSEQIKELDKIIFNSPHSAIIKGRIIGEAVLKEISKLEGYGPLDMSTQMERMMKLKSEKVLQNEIYNVFNSVRLIGNKAAHSNLEGELEQALNIHKNIYKISCWFTEVYIDYEFKCLTYKNPIPPMNPNDDDNKWNIRCLVKELSKLRESSKEAVEGLVKFTDFKRYMHVEREAQKKLQELIFKVNESNEAQLILVSGSVGDGKSHIISYFNNKHPDIMKKFTLYNDATESLEPSKTSMDTLNIILDGFSDEKIDGSNMKVILAINLGTLNNFIDSEYGKRFSLLKKYVFDKKIIESSIEDNNFDKNSSFQFVNFSDYHIFTLKNGQVRSNYIESLISKVVDPSEFNIFYNSYNENCPKCNNVNRCPIKSNYELLGSKTVQKSIIYLLIQCIIKKKIIISTRALINFIYELIVPISYIDVNSPTLKNEIYKINNSNYIKALMPNIIFNHKELSFIFEALSNIDPLDIRNKKIDSLIIEFNNTTDLSYYFDKYIDFPEMYMSNIDKIDFSETQDGKLRHEILKLFIRGYCICGKENIFSLNDEVYEEYMINIYFWNKGDKIKLKKLYDNVKNGILKWNGEADKDQINIFMGKNQTKYRISEDIELSPDTSNLRENDIRELKKFATTLRLQYKGNQSDKTYEINIDFALYLLLVKINNGYRPNRRDKNQFINFIEFINKLEEMGSQDIKLIFTEKNKELNRKYKLEYDSEFEFYRFMEIKI